MITNDKNIWLNNKIPCWLWWCVSEYIISISLSSLLLSSVVIGTEVFIEDGSDDGSEVILVTDGVVGDTDGDKVGDTVGCIDGKSSCFWFI